LENRVRLNHLLNTIEGQAIMELLADEVDGSCYAKGDPHHTAYLEGRRDVLTYMREVKDNARPASIRSRGSAASRRSPGVRARGDDPTTGPE
jgi:hypothetical protein